MLRVRTLLLLPLIHHRVLHQPSRKVERAIDQKCPVINVVFAKSKYAILCVHPTCHILVAINIHGFSSVTESSRAALAATGANLRNATSLERPITAPSTSRKRSKRLGKLTRTRSGGYITSRNSWQERPMPVNSTSSMVGPSSRPSCPLLKSTTLACGQPLCYDLDPLNCESLEATSRRITYISETYRQRSSSRL